MFRICFIYVTVYPVYELFFMGNYTIPLQNVFLLCIYSIRIYVKAFLCYSHFFQL